MTLVIEDGAGVIGANSYADLACADSWCVPRGLWPETAVNEDDQPDEAAVKEKEAALIRAFDWLNGLDWLGGGWSGTRTAPGRAKMRLFRAMRRNLFPKGIFRSRWSERRLSWRR